MLDILYMLVMGIEISVPDTFDCSRVSIKWKQLYFIFSLNQQHLFLY